jgi:hypothetical protein
MLEDFFSAHSNDANGDEMENDVDDEMEDGEDNNSDEEEEENENYNQTIPNFRSLNDTEDKIVKLMEYSRELINIIQSQSDEVDANQQEQLVQQFLDEIKVSIVNSKINIF